MRVCDKTRQPLDGDYLKVTVQRVGYTVVRKKRMFVAKTSKVYELMPVFEDDVNKLVSGWVAEKK